MDITFWSFSNSQEKKKDFQQISMLHVTHEINLCVCLCIFVLGIPQPSPKVAGTRESIHTCGQEKEEDNH